MTEGYCSAHTLGMASPTMYLNIPSPPHKLTVSNVPFQVVMGHEQS